VLMRNTFSQYRQFPLLHNASSFCMFISCACYFVCRWLDSGADDGLIERKIDAVHYVETPPPKEPLPDEPG